MSTDKTKRLLYIDALRGMTMILVVYHHIVNQCFPETILDKGLQSFRMPIFFLVSGFIAYKELDFWTGRNTLKRLLKKFRVQVIPTVIFFSLYFYFVKGNNPISAFVDSGWHFYWFTIVLFEFFVVYYSVSYLTSKSSKANLVALIVLIISSIVLFHTLDKTDRWSTWVHAYSFTMYMPFFLAGTLLRQYFDRVSRFLEKWWLLAADIIVFATLLLTMYLCVMDVMVLPQRVINVIDTWGLRITGSIMVFGLFVKFRDRFTADKKITRSLSFIGRRTLDIYLLHFFFLARLKFIHAYIIDSGLEQWERPFTVLFTGIVVVACLLVSGLIRKWKPAGKLLFAAKY